jgi:hypothetical protein
MPLPGNARKDSGKVRVGETSSFDRGRAGKNGPLNRDATSEASTLDPALGPAERLPQSEAGGIPGRQTPAQGPGDPPAEGSPRCRQNRAQTANRRLPRALPLAAKGARPRVTPL